MSRNQKAPLLAFALVALVCGLVLVDTMRGEAEPHPLDVLSQTEPGPAYDKLPKQPPIAPVEQGDEGESLPEATGAPDLAKAAASASPGSSEGGQASADSQASAPVSQDDGSQLQGTPSDDHTDGPADADDATGLGELWPPSSLPGIKNPIVAFTIFDPDDLWPGNGPKDEPSHQPSHQPSQQPSHQPSHQPNAGADQGDGHNGPRDPGHSEGPPQPDPTSGPSSEPPSAAPSTTP